MSKKKRAEIREPSEVETLRAQVAELEAERQKAALTTKEVEKAEAMPVIGDPPVPVMPSTITVAAQGFLCLALVPRPEIPQDTFLVKSGKDTGKTKPKGTWVKARRLFTMLAGPTVHEVLQGNQSFVAYLKPRLEAIPIVSAYPFGLDCGPPMASTEAHALAPKVGLSYEELYLGLRFLFGTNKQEVAQGALGATFPRSGSWSSTWGLWLRRPQEVVLWEGYKESRDVYQGI